MKDTKKGADYVCKETVETSKVTVREGEIVHAVKYMWFIRVTFGEVSFTIQHPTFKRYFKEREGDV